MMPFRTGRQVDHAFGGHHIPIAVAVTHATARGDHASGCRPRARRGGRAGERNAARFSVIGYHTNFDAQSIVLLFVALKYFPVGEQLSSCGVCPCATIAMPPSTIMGASNCYLSRSAKTDQI